MPQEFLKFLHKRSITEVELGDQVQQEMTILFMDIRGFTTLSERMTPKETFGFINEFLSRMEPVISEHQGVIDKYIGDAIMALFPSATEAMQASVGMLAALAAYNEVRAERQKIPIRIGIGLNFGIMTLGTVGGQTRMDSTVISDAVNVASRVEESGEKKLASLGIFDEACRSFESGDLDKAKTLFQQCWDDNPEDHVARIYLKRCTAAA